MNSKKLLIATTVMSVGLLLATSAFAQASPAQGQGGFHGGMRGQTGVVGTVSAINGTTLTVAGRVGPQGGTATTYSVDASNATVTKSGAASSVSAIAVGDTVMVQGTVSGTSVTAKTIRDGVMQGAGRGSGIFGTVASVNGTTLTVTSKGRMMPRQTQNSNNTATTYTVNAGSATVTKNGATSSVSAIAAGDSVAVQGTVSGTTVTATTIRDGMGQGQNGGQPAMQGNGQPIVAGSVTSISGTTLTVTTSTNIVYTVDASNAKVTKGKTASAVSSIATGDKVVVQGTVNGTSVAASSVMDQAAPKSSTGTQQSGGNGIFGGMMGVFKNFFHMFGF